MGRFKKLHTLNTIAETGIVPVFYNANLETAKNVVKACYNGGIRAFEFTNRGDFAHEIFGALVKWAATECPEMIMGAGTILDAPTAALYIQLGANFIVSPALNSEVAILCNTRGIPYSPGCGSVTEIQEAQKLGCDLVKVFPAGNVGGPSFVKNMLAPLPWSMVMVTGGVKPTEENLAEWGKAGVTAVGMGSKLFPKEIVAEGKWDEISKLSKSSIQWLNNNR